MGPPRPLDGSEVLYGYLQHELQRSDVWLFQMLTARLIVGLGVWLDPEVYARQPLLRPYAVRDPKARGNKSKGEPDEWGAPDPRGLFRDDNSLIKRMPYSLPVHGPRNRRYDGARLERGFVASHVWRKLIDDRELASRNRLTYSFVPNLIWLPQQISMLTDREGSFVQQYIQAVSLKLYRSVPVSETLRPIVEESWALLPEPTGVPPEGVPDPNELNTFVPGDSFFKARSTDLAKVLEALRTVRDGGKPKGKVVSSRYGAGLPQVSKRSLSKLERALSAYLSAVESPAETSAR
jgi:hypothetical protein